MRLIQMETDSSQLCVGVVDEAGLRVRVLDGVAGTRELAMQAIDAGVTLEQQATTTPGARLLDYAQVLAAGRVRSPLHHPDPAHCLVSGTGLTHLGSAAARDAMHQKLRQQAEQGTLTDSMRMFQWGVEGGTPAPGQPGVQPEWFYKGNGAIVVHPGAPLDSPDFALDAGEEPELVGLYLIGPDGTPFRLGFAIGNEFSDHVTERSNYLYLAHSKMRCCAVGPELRTGSVAARPARHQPHPSGCSSGVGKALSYRRGQHVPFAGKPRIPPLQVRSRIGVRATCTCTSSVPPR